MMSKEPTKKDWPVANRVIVFITVLICLAILAGSAVAALLAANADWVKARFTVPHYDEVMPRLLQVIFHLVILVAALKLLFLRGSGQEARAVTVILSALAVYERQWWVFVSLGVLCLSFVVQAIALARYPASPPDRTGGSEQGSVGLSSGSSVPAGSAGSSGTGGG